MNILPLRPGTLAVAVAWVAPVLFWAALALGGDAPLKHAETLMLLPVALGSWIGGLTGGIGAVIFGAIAVWDLTGPFTGFGGSGGEPIDWFTISAFLVVGSLFCATHEAMRRSRGKLAEQASTETVLLADRDRLAQALDRDSARLAAVVRSSNDAIAATDAEGRFVSWNAAAEKMFGYHAGEVIGRTPAELIVPQDLMEDHLRVTDLLLNGALLPPFDTVRMTKDGRRIDVSAAPSPIKDSQGGFIGISALWRDITERKRAERMLAASEAKYRLLADNVQDYITLFDSEGKVLYDSPSIVRMMGEHYNPTRKIGEDPGIVYHDDRPAIREAFLQVVGEKKELLAEYRWLVPNVGIRWVEHRFTPIVGADGGVERVIALSRDVTARRHAEEAQHVLVRELHHRTRNILAIVQSIARDTLHDAPVPAAFAKLFEDRLAALSRVQSLISRPNDEPITLIALLAQELDAMGPGRAPERTTLAGPEIEVPRNAVQLLGLAIHELATNSRKYGALGGERGHLSVKWDFDRTGSEERLVFEWVESDIVSHAAQDAQNGLGYGRTLIEKALPYTLSAETEFELSAGRLRCVISLPLATSDEVKP